MQPTLRQVPPRVPRFSIQVTWKDRNVSPKTRLRASGMRQYLQALLTGLDGSDVACDAATDDDKVLLIYPQLVLRISVRCATSGD